MTEFTLVDRRLGNKTLTIVKQEVQVLFREVNRRWFDGVLPDPYVFADRHLSADGEVEWYLQRGTSPTVGGLVRGRPTVRISYEALMTVGVEGRLRDGCLREFVHHWQHFTGRQVVKDAEFWAKAKEIGYSC